MSGTIATCGTKVETWSLNGAHAERLSSTMPHTGKVNMVQWNHNNQVLAAAGADGFVTLNHFKGQVLGKLPTPKDEGFADERFSVLSLSLSVGSRYLCSGGRDHLVKVWDLKTQRLIRKFESHTGVVTSVAFNRKDSVVASADLAGDILAHSVATGEKIWHLSAIDKGGRSVGVNHLSYSPYVASRLATSSVDGSVQVWDVAQGVQSCAFTAAHTATTTALFFSPVNQLLLVSTGLDHKMNFFDSHDAKTVMSLSAPQPLTAGAFMADGTNVLAGTRSGAMYVFDLRKPNSPKATHLLGPANEIAYIARQNVIKPKDKKKAGGKGGGRVITPRGSRGGSGGTTLSSTKLVDSSSKPLVRPGTAGLARATKASARPRSAATTPKHGGAGASAKNTPAVRGAKASSAAAASSGSNSAKPRGGAAIAAGAAGATGAPKAAPATVESKADGAGSAAAAAGGNKRAGKPRQPSPPVGAEGSAPAAGATAGGSAGGSGSGSGGGRRRGAAAGAAAATAAAAFDFGPTPGVVPLSPGKQLSFASAEAILDQMEDDKEELKGDIRQLHLEMLRQFQQQQTDTAKQLQAMMTRLQELYGENKALREENARLKAVY